MAAGDEASRALCALSTFRGIVDRDIPWQECFIRSFGRAPTCVEYADYGQVYDVTKPQHNWCDRAHPDRETLTKCGKCYAEAEAHNQSYADRAAGPMAEETGVQKLTLDEALCSALGDAILGVLQATNERAADLHTMPSGAVVGGFFGYTLTSGVFDADGQARSTMYLSSQDVAAFSNEDLYALIRQLASIVPAGVRAGHFAIVAQGPSYSSTQFLPHTDTPQENHIKDRNSGRAALTTCTLLHGSSSSMRVLGKTEVFTYSKIGDTSLFLADCVHESLPTENDCIKLVGTWVFDEGADDAASAYERVEVMMSTNSMAGGSDGGFALAVRLFEAVKVTDTLSRRIHQSLNYGMLLVSLATAVTFDLMARQNATGTDLNDMITDIVRKANESKLAKEIPGAARCLRARAAFLRAFVSQVRQENEEAPCHLRDTVRLQTLPLLTGAWTRNQGCRALHQGGRQ